MAGEVNTGMDKTEMKRLLAKSKQEPVNCAFGQGKDKTVALLLLDKIKGPRGVEKDLVKQFPDANNTRFGVALVDMDDDPKEVKFRINKMVSGAARKLIKTLKGTGYTKVVIMLDDGTVVEKDSEEEEQPTTETQGTETVTPPSNEPEASNVPPPPPPPPPQPQAPAYDKAALTKQWNDLVKEIPAALAKAPLLKDQLTKYATDGQVNLKTDNLAYAAAAIEQLRRALEAVKAGETGASKATYEKSAKIWHAIRGQMEEKIEALRSQIVTTYEPTGLSGQLDTAYRNRVSGVLEMLDESLADKLESASQVLDPTARATLVQEAKVLIQTYKGFVDTDGTITELDSNPFGVDMKLRATVGGALGVLAKSVA